MDSSIRRNGCRLVYLVCGVALLASVVGCTIPDSAWQEVAARRVNLTAWGINYTGPFGLLNMGYVQYQRNPDETLQPEKPPEVKP